MIPPDRTGQIWKKWSVGDARVFMVTSTDVPSTFTRGYYVFHRCVNLATGEAYGIVEHGVDPFETDTSLERIV